MSTINSDRSLETIGAVDLRSDMYKYTFHIVMEIRLVNEEETALTSGDLPERPTSIRDETDNFSLINFLGGRLKEVVMALPEEMLMMTDGELRKRAVPTNADFALRVSFWREFERVMWKGTGVIQPRSIIAGIVSDQYFYKDFLGNAIKVAFMVRPMQTYNREMEAILMRATERLWELIEIPIYNSKGRFDAKAAEVLMKAVTQVENRVKGMAVQKSENKRVNFNVTTRTKAIQGIDTMASLDARIKQLETEVNSEVTIIDSGEDGAGINQVIPIEVKEEEREAVESDTLRSEDISERI